MKKLLIFHACLPSYRIDLFNSLSNDFKVKAVLYGKKENLEKLAFDYKSMLNKADFEYVVYDSGLYIGNNHLLSSMYYHEINKFKPDLVFCQELGVNTLAAIILKKKFNYKIFINCDDSPAMLQNYGRLRRFLRNYVYKKVDGILVVHTEVEKKLKELFPKNTFLYVPIIQDEAVFYENLKKSNAVKENYMQKYNLKNQTVFLFVGRLETEKQPDFLLEAYHRANIENSRLVIVGDGTLNTKLKEYVINNHLEKQVLLTGSLYGKELYAWFSLADYFVLPSKFEPFGAVVNEALIAGCKVIVSNKVGANTLVNQNNGEVFCYNNMEALKHLLIKSAEDNSKNRNQNLMPFSFNVMYNKLKSFLNDL